MFKAFHTIIFTVFLYVNMHCLKQNSIVSTPRNNWQGNLCIVYNKIVNWTKSNVKICNPSSFGISIINWRVFIPAAPPGLQSLGVTSWIVDFGFSGPLAHGNETPLWVLVLPGSRAISG